MSTFREKRSNKKQGTWRVRFQHQGKRYEADGFAKKEDGKVWEVEEKKRLRAPAPSTTYTISFAEAATRYISDCEARMAKNTWRAKLSYYRKFIKFAGKETALHSVTSTQINDFILGIKKEEGSKNANRHLKDLKALFNWCLRREEMDISRNPCLFVEPLAEDPFVKYVPTMSDILKIMEVASPEENDLITIIMHTFGGRVGEILRLKWKDVDFDSRSVSLWTKKRKRGEYREVKKPMDETLYLLLQRKLKERENGNGNVLINPRTKQPYSVRPRWMENLCERAGVHPFGYHAIRHAVAHYLDQSQALSLKEISELIGHDRPTTTDNYLRSLSRSLRKATRILDDVMPYNGGNDGQRYEP